jgi:hypothetical protein
MQSEQHLNLPAGEMDFQGSDDEDLQGERMESEK